MNNNIIVTEDILWEYADGLLAPDAKALVDKYLAQQPSLREQLEAILQEKRAFASLPLERPAADFADTVMAAWAAQQRQKPAAVPQRDWGLWAIVAGMGSLLAVPLLWAMMTGDFAGGGGSSLRLPEFEMPLALQNFDLLAALRSPVSQFGFYLALALMSVQMLEKILRYRHFLQTRSATDLA